MTGHDLGYRQASVRKPVGKGKINSTTHIRSRLRTEKRRRQGCLFTRSDKLGNDRLQPGLRCRADQASGSAIVRIWISMIRELGAWVHASRTALATSSGSSIF